MQEISSSSGSNSVVHRQLKLLGPNPVPNIQKFAAAYGSSAEDTNALDTILRRGARVLKRNAKREQKDAGKVGKGASAQAALLDLDGGSGASETAGLSGDVHS